MLFSCSFVIVLVVDPDEVVVDVVELAVEPVVAWTAPDGDALIRA
jgi:hypothetical protein